MLLDDNCNGLNAMGQSNNWIVLQEGQVKGERIIFLVRNEEIAKLELGLPRS